MCFCFAFVFEQSMYMLIQTFLRALELEPTNPKVQATYAIFLETVVKQFDDAEKMYQAAALSGLAPHIRSYAKFLRVRFSVKLFS